MEKKNMELEAVIFDLDGVLANTIEYHYQSWKEVARHIGIRFSREDNDRLRGLSRRSSLDVLLAGRNVSEDKLYELLEMKNDLFIQSIKNMGPQDLQPGVAALFAELHSARIPIGVASSSANVHLVIEKLGLGEYIAAVGDRYKVVKLKPEPDIFLYTASALGRTPVACIVIEDSIAGIQAAHAAGMCVLAVDSVSRAGERADAYYDSLEQVTLKTLRDIHRRWMETGPARSSGLEPEKKVENRIDLYRE
jgi:beta-phosphoglucomutase